MRKKTLALLGLLLVCPAWADDGPGLPRDVSFETLVFTTLAIEGLTGDDQGNLYTTGRTPPAGQNCPVWRIAANVSNPPLVPVGFVPAPCQPSGITFGPEGDLYISNNNDTIYRVTPNAASPDLATPYGTGVPGTNGLAFDRDGNLWTGDGTTNQGRVWKIAPGGGAGEEMFRVQPMANRVGVGREVRTLPPGTAQGLVANGIAFNHDGDMLIADTARGAIWKVQLNRDGTLRSRIGCDTTFVNGDGKPNALCLENILVAHPILEGADGIALDAAGNIWVDVNERNAIGVVTKKGEVVEIFRNPPDPTTNLRNTGPLETPTSPFLLGHKFCTANSDGNRRDNNPPSAGEIPALGLGKISCMVEPLKIPGMRLPI